MNCTDNITGQRAAIQHRLPGVDDCYVLVLADGRRVMRLNSEFRRDDTAPRDGGGNESDAAYYSRQLGE